MNQRPCPRSHLPATARVVIVGAGYAGLNAALELHREGIDAIVLDANEPGFGGSTRNGGMVSGGVNVGKRYMAKAMADAEAAPYLTRRGGCLQPCRRADRAREDRLRLDAARAISSAPGARAITRAWRTRWSC